MLTLVGNIEVLLRPKPIEDTIQEVEEPLQAAVA